MRHLLFLPFAFSLSLPLLSGCSGGLPGTGGPSDDGGVQIRDSGNGGNASADGGAPSGDAGSNPGGGGTPDGGNGGGNNPGSPDGGGSFSFPDGGFSLPDAGLSSYMGSPEPGVKCGEALETCDVGAACCLKFSLSPFGFSGQCSLTNDDQCEDGERVAACDGPEECTGINDGVCCVVGLNDFQPTTTCMTATECDDVDMGGSRVCTGDVDCPLDQLCCGVTLSLPIDMGVCRSSC